MMASTRIITRIVALVLVSLPVFAGSAAAECAWALWRNDPRAVVGEPSLVTHHWQIVEAFTGLGGSMTSMLARGHCERQKKELILALPEKSRTEYLCLPDTIDPRRPVSR